MSYAIRNDLQGFRAVSGPNDIGPDEFYSETPIDIVPVPKVPDRVTMRQARLALLGAGLLDDVEAAINALPGDQGKAARIEWDYSSEVHRDKPFVIQLGTALGLSNEQLDQLFITAAGIE